MNVSILNRLKNSSITKKLYFIVGIMALLITFGLFTLWFSITTLSAVRATIGGEGLWSKAEKSAVFHLKKYATTGNDNYYKEYLEYLKVPLGDRKALYEFVKVDPNIELARQGLLEGRNHPNDVEGIIKLFTKFKNSRYIHKALITWIEGDAVFSKLSAIGENLHQEITSENPSNARMKELLQELSITGDQLTILEDNFSYTLAEGARWFENSILKFLFIVALFVELFGLLFAFSISMKITKEIKEIIRVTDKVSKNDFSDRAKIYSKDEIGTLAKELNKMIDALQSMTNHNIQVENELKNTAKELIRSNKELEQFAYVASHDLQEPLRMVTSYVQLLESRYKDKLDKDAKEFIGFAIDGTVRMKNLILSLLEYSRVNKKRPFVRLDLNPILDNVLKNLETQIKENNAIIKIDPLPDFNGDEVLITQLFQNLISNAIKFRGLKNPQIVVSGKKDNDVNLFSVKDNGIGIPKEHYDKIFMIFQRLHPKEKFPGTGIGLAICKKIVEQHGGKIWFESEVDKGTTFYFTIK